VEVVAGLAVELLELPEPLVHLELLVLLVLLELLGHLELLDIPGLFFQIII